MAKKMATIDLPEEIQQIIQLKRQKSQERIAALGIIVAKKREEAISARKSLGIDRIIQEDEEYYLGIDDENRSTHAFTKSMSPNGGLSSNTKSEKSDNRCTAFFNITRQFVDSASARMGDILLPSGDWNFTIKPTPIPELLSLKDSAAPIVNLLTNQRVTNQDGSTATLGQFAQSETAAIDERVRKAEQRIKDWLTECQYHAEVRKVIEDAAKVGTGVLRGAYPALSKTRAIVNGALVIEEKTVPASKRINPVNFFPDPACGDNIQNGSYVFERDFLSARQLRDLKNEEGYIAENIDKVLEEGAKKNQAAINDNDKDRFEVWYYFGMVDIDDLDALGVSQDAMEGKDLAPAVVVMVNDTVIKGFVNPLDTGEFPYDVMPWQRISDSPWGIGVSRQGRTAQETVNASARVMMENLGLSGSPQVILRQSAIRPADGDWNLVRGKLWLATAEADTRSVSDAFVAVNIPSMQQEMANVIQMGYKMFEDATGISFLLQGQQGSAPDTVGGMQLLHQNASSLLRRVARVFDENITEPHIRRYYDWLMMYGDDDEKGDLHIEAVGSSSLVEREIQSMQAAQILQMALNPAFGYSPKKAADELLRSWRFNPAKFEMDEKEKQSMQQSAPPPQVVAAQIRAESDKQVAQIKAQADLAMDKNDTDRDAIYVKAQSDRDSNQAAYLMQKLQLEKEIAILKYATDKQISLEKVKADLASKSMELQVQRELSAAANEIQLASSKRGKEPQVAASQEVIGRAPDGMSFER